MNKSNLPPKIQAMFELDCKPIIDQMLLKDVPGRKVKEYLKNEHGFEISLSYLQKYKKAIKSVTAEELNIDNFMNQAPVSKVIIEDTKKPKETYSDKIKSDLEFIDMVIQTGADNLRAQIKNNEANIEIKDVFDAIKLKDQLTDGAMGALTEYGIQHLQEMTEQKYMTLLSKMYEYIPAEQKEAILKELERTEETFYKDSDYYEEYLRAMGFNEKQIKDKMNE